MMNMEERDEPFATHNQALFEKKKAELIDVPSLAELEWT